MKLKQQPDDFQVEELTDRVPEGRGPFAFYLLEKRGWTTHDALSAVGRHWQLEPRQISYGGLKDRHAHTTQHITIWRGPKRGLTHHGIDVHYLGQVTAPFSSRDIRANRFRITLRDLSDAETAAAAQTLEEVRRDGVPNYFDDQRFGSIGSGREFVARLLILDRFEDALRLALAAPYAYDRAEEKRVKETLLAHWGDWAACRERLPRCHARSIVDFLVHHPTDFKGAVLRLRPEWRGLYLSAYQSHVWNRVLARWLRAHLQLEQLVDVPLRLGVVPMQRALDDEQRTRLQGLAVPLPSARYRPAPDEPLLPLIEAVLAEDGLTLSDMRIRGMRQPFFSRGDRAASSLPAGLEFEVRADEAHLARQALVMKFDLARGSYATLVVKRVQAAADPNGAAEDDDSVTL